MDHGNRSVDPWKSTARELPGSRMTWTAPQVGERRRGAVGDPDGRVAAADAAYGPVPEHLVQGRVEEAMTVQSRVDGLVTMGPTMTLRVWARIWL